MSQETIDYTDKEQNAVSGLPNERKWRFEDANEVKSVVNNNGADAQSQLDGKQGNNLVVVLDANSQVDQNPVGLDNPLQITFGAAQGGPSDPVELDAAGNVKFNQAGNYHLSLYAHIGRSGNPGVSEIRLRKLLNGVQASQTIGEKLDNNEVLIYINIDSLLAAEVNDIITFEIMRDSSGDDSGGLRVEPTTPVDWQDGPSAGVILEIFN